MRKAPRGLLVQRRPRRSPRWSSFPALSWARQSERRLASSSRAPCPAADDVVADERAAVAARDGAAVAVALEDASARLLPFSGEVERIGPLDQRRDRLLRGANAGAKHSHWPIPVSYWPRPIASEDPGVDRVALTGPLLRETRSGTARGQRRDISGTFPRAPAARPERSGCWRLADGRPARRLASVSAGGHFRDREARLRRARIR